MERKHTTLRDFINRALRHTWLFLYGLVWSLFGTVTRIRDNFLPPSWKQALETHHLLGLLPQMSWPSWVIGILLLAIIAIVRSALMQITDREKALFEARDEVERLTRVPLSLEVEVEDIMHRVSFETKVLMNRDIFLHVNAVLKAPQAAHVEYEFSFILKGKTLKAEWIRDIADWVRTERVTEADPFNANADAPAYEIDELLSDLSMGDKVDGWLHFRTRGIPDRDLFKCKLRLIAQSENGASSYDIPEGKLSLMPGKEKMVLKSEVQAYSLRSTAKALPPPI